MTTCGTVTKSLLLLAVVVAMTGRGSAVEKLSECCTKVARQEIPETIVDYVMQYRNGRCVNAVIFQTESGVFYCSKVKEPWVLRKVTELREMRRRKALASASSLPITSTSSPPSTSSLLKLITSMARTTEMP